MQFDTLDTSNFKSTEKIRARAEEKEKYFPDLSENMQKLLKQAYIFCYAGNYKNEITKTTTD